MSLRRVMRIASAVGLLATAVFAAGPASAGVVGGGGKPSPRGFVPSGLPFTLDAGDACAFGVTISEVQNKEFARTFPNGNTLVTGQLVVTLTNDATGRSVVRDISGPVLVTSGANGEPVTVFSGSSLTFIFEGQDDTGLLGQGVFIVHGPTVFVGTRLTSVSGATENLCMTLA